jgi:glycosyltransferase involved in cell wall biosynthesis
MARVQIISNLNNGAGLQKDFELLRDLLVEQGHQVVGVHFRGPCNSTADLNIFLEVIVPAHMWMARRNFFIPNPEWYFNQWDECLSRFTAVLCKTRACLELFKSKVPESKLHFTGFFSKDLYEPAIPRERRFLHAAGLSQTKNTVAIIDAWNHFKIPYPLTVVSDHYGGRYPNITFMRRISDGQIKVLMNSHQFHLMPSMYEGFGHAIHEGFSCKAVMITTNVPPMNEWVAPPELLSQPRGMQQHHLAALCFIPKEQIEESVRKAWDLVEGTSILPTEGTSTLIGNRARGFFLQERPNFAERFGELL